MIKKLFSIFLCICILFSASGCSQDFSLDYIIQSNPQNIDPQLAESDTELLIVRNIFEGLLRFDQDGRIVHGVISDYKFDAQTLTYTFTIKEDACWSNGQTLTAQDFVFAFRRAVDKKTQAPNATALLCIKNANSIMHGSMDATHLGITALSEKQLEIKLDYNDPYFLQTLASPVAMPCNEEFFNSCGGKYGLSEKYILSNGSFKITKWKDQKKIRLIKNDEYTGQFSAKANTVFLYIPSGEKTAFNLLADGNADLGEITYSEEAAALNNGLKTTEIQNTTYALLFNKKSVFKNDELRKAFALSVHRNLYISKLPVHFQKADSIFPKSISVNEKTLQDEALKNKSVLEFDAQQARTIFLNAVKTTAMPTITVLYEDNTELKNVLTDIVSQWQQVLGAYVNIEALSSSALKSRVQNGSYSIAFYPLRDQNGNAKTFLEQFVSESSINAFTNANYDALVEQLSKNQSALQNACDAEKLLLSDASVIPILYSQRVFAYNKELKKTNVTTTAGFIDFAYIEK